MKAALLHQFNQLPKIEVVADPDCPIDGVVVRVEACGVCRSDHHAWVGADPDVELPHVMGHEFAGIIVDVGRNCANFKKGDRVTAPFILGCGQCSDCACGEPTICENQAVIGFTQWGAFAELVAMPTADYNLVHLPESIGYAEAAGMGCRVTTAWRGLHDRGVLQAGEWVVIHGCGGVGLSAIMLAKAMSARIIAVDISPNALDIAEALGAEVCINASDVENVPEAVHVASGGGAHLSIEALGITTTFENSLRSLRKLGRHVQIGMPLGSHATVPLPLLDLIYSRQLTLYGMRGLGAPSFTKLFDLIVDRKIDLSQLVTGRIVLSQLGYALTQMNGDQSARITVVDNLSG